MSISQVILQQLPSPRTLTWNVSVLGLAWHPSENVFYFHFDDIEPASRLTKRIVQSRTAKLFDSQGWLAPVIVKAKILMQLLWLKKRGWDKVISPELQEIWQRWKDKLPHINFLKIPRCNNFNPKASVLELHGFALRANHINVSNSRINIQRIRFSP